MNIDPNTRLIDLTVGELIELIGKNQAAFEHPALPQKRLVYGIAGIARLFNKSMTTANRIKVKSLCRIERETGVPRRIKC